MEDRQAKLGRFYIEEYLKERGHTWESAHALPPAESRRLCIDAVTYAAVKLAEVEMKARVSEGIHGVTEAMHD